MRSLAKGFDYPDRRIAASTLLRPAGVFAASITRDDPLVRLSTSGRVTYIPTCMAS